MKIAYPKVTKLLKASKIRIEKEKQLGSSRSTIKTKLQIFEKHDLPQLRTTRATDYKRDPPLFMMYWTSAYLPYKNIFSTITSNLSSRTIVRK